MKKAVQKVMFQIHSGVKHAERKNDRGNHLCGCGCNEADAEVSNLA